MTYPARRDGDELFPATTQPPTTLADRLVGVAIGTCLLAAYWWSLAL